MSENNKERRKRRRWGDTPSSAAAETTTTTSAPTPAPAPGAPEGASDAAAKKAALQQSISARLAALKAKKSQAVAKASATLGSARNNANASRTTAIVPPPAAFPPPSARSSDGQPASKKAKVYDLDLSVTAPSYQKSVLIGAVPPKPIRKINPYLAHLEHGATRDSSKSEERNPLQKSDGGGGGADADDEMILDNRLAAGRMHKARRKKELQFVQPGTFIELAERKRAKAENAAKSGFASGRKVGTFVKSSGMAQIGGGGGANVIPGEDNYYGASSASAIVEDVTTMAKSIPRADVVGESIDGSSKSTGGVVAIPTPMIMEWWDVDSLLPYKLKKEVVAMEGRAVTLRATNRMNLLKSSKSKAGTSSEKKDEDGMDAESKEQKQTQDLTQKCAAAASISNSKTYKLVQHPAPVKPPNAPTEDALAPTLHLTKKEMKRQRKLRRAEKQRELQDLQAAGLISAPEPKLTLSNFMRVLGDQAVMDPSKMEAKVMEQVQGRKQKHEKMNADRQLSKEQRSEKRDRKLTEDTSQAVSVALFLVKDMSHRYHRTKVDLNAQQNKITGGVLECEMPKMSLVICEGGAKAIKRYVRLMLVRMKWKGENFMEADESEDEHENEDNEEGQKQKFNSENSCELVWQGMAPKRMFRTFVFQTCETSEVARKVLEAKGVAHFWDQVLVHASGSGESFNFKLGDGDMESGDEDIVMKESF
uniref:Uncharacterized protein n=1 Tax=Chaetoceros debilis TaxID=122233 RepID=A0A7S3Q056_9STRA